MLAAALVAAPFQLSFDSFTLGTTIAQAQENGEGDEGGPDDEGPGDGTEGDE